MSPLSKAYYVLRYLGPRVVWLRAGVYLRRGLGITAWTFRSRPWERIELSAIARPGTPADPAGYQRFKRNHPPPFLFSPGRPPEPPAALRAAPAERRPPLSQRLRLLAEGRCVYFFRLPAPEPIDWYRNPLEGKRGERDRCWCEIPDFAPQQGDMRTLWEPARAAWALDLARARAHGLSGRWGELLWRWVDSWMASCPPFRGVHWKCGQESAVRFIAIALGCWSLADDPAMTAQRWVQLARLAWATGYRIEHQLGYALSQKNNHALSEACGLLLLGQLFPELRAAGRWQALGRRLLAREIRRQTYPDGSYLQHSMNYHRLMLDACLLGLRLAELSGRPFERRLYQRLGRCAEFLFQMMDPDTGRLPNYGHNDGASLLPLSECDFTDYRPAIQAANYLVRRERLLPAGPWDEELLWLFGPAALAARSGRRRRPASSAFEAGGYYTLRRQTSWAMVRCHSYRDRPGQCDPLHLDLWWRGQNLLQDCGTYRYYHPQRPDIEHYFKSIAAHNTIMVDGADPAALAARFLWLPWPRARKRHFVTAGGEALWFEGEHYGYDRAPWHVVHRRSVISLSGDAWLVVDDLLGRGTHAARLYWHMLEAPCELDAARRCLRLRTAGGEVFLAAATPPGQPLGFELLRGRDRAGEVQGFASRYYGQRSAIPTLELAWEGRLPLRVVTALCPAEPLLPGVTVRSGGRERWLLAGRSVSCVVELAAARRACRQTVLSVVPGPGAGGQGRT